MKLNRIIIYSVTRHCHKRWFAHQPAHCVLPLRCSWCGKLTTFRHFTAVETSTVVLQVLSPLSPVSGYQRFVGIYHLHFHGNIYRWDEEGVVLRNVCDHVQEPDVTIQNTAVEAQGSYRNVFSWYKGQHHSLLVTMNWQSLHFLESFFRHKSCWVSYYG
jgi:hypothetical protein